MRKSVRILKQQTPDASFLHTADRLYVYGLDGLDGLDGLNGLKAEQILPAQMS
jgi:hypothetical protein